MSSASLKVAIPYGQFDQLREAREIIRTEADALRQLSSSLGTTFCHAADLVFECSGRVLITGIGKAGLIGQKIAATLSSTGTRAHFLHPAEAVHGDLGSVSDEDVIIAISNSGETEEIVRLLPIIRQLGASLIAMTARENSTLGARANVVLELGELREAGELGLAPSTSTTAMLAMGDALALVVSRRKSFSSSQFSVFHPGGSLGRQLTPIRDIMRHGDELRIAKEQETIRTVLQRLRSTGRRSGATLIIDDEDVLSGIFTDSDLAKLLEQHRDHQLDRPIAEVMTRNPATLDADACLNDAVIVLTEKKISELPVVDEACRPVGLIDITDVIGLAPECA
jgi:arabinose-5-phosphate isomerase